MQAAALAAEFERRFGARPGAGACAPGRVNLIGEHTDALCEIADALPGVHGSRLTGAGFGGCTVHLVESIRAGEVAAALAAGFALRFGRRASVWTCVASEGARAIDGAALGLRTRGRG